MDTEKTLPLIILIICIGIILLMTRNLFFKKSKNEKESHTDKTLNKEKGNHDNNEFVKQSKPIPESSNKIKDVVKSKELTFEEIVGELRIILNNKDYNIPEDFEVESGLGSNFSIETLESLSQPIFRYVSNLKKSIDMDLTMDMGLELNFTDSSFLKLEIMNCIKDNQYRFFRGPFEISLFQITSDKFDLIKDRGFVEFLYDCTQYINTVINEHRGN